MKDDCREPFAHKPFVCEVSLFSRTATRTLLSIGFIFIATFCPRGLQKVNTASLQVWKIAVNPSDAWKMPDGRCGVE